MEKLLRILTKPLLVLLLIIQCAFLVFILNSVPKENGQLRTALSSLRTPSQSNIAPINQNEARELRLVLEELINSHKSFTTVSVLFSFVSIALMVTMVLPFGFKRASETSEFDSRLKL
jgi:hypothetical protein